MISMPRRFLIVTMCLVGTVTFLIGLIVAGSLTPTPAHSAPGRKGAVVRPAKSPLASSPALASFAEVAERINPAVVNIDAGFNRRQRHGNIGYVANQPRVSSYRFGRRYTYFLIIAGRQEVIESIDIQWKSGGQCAARLFNHVSIEDKLVIALQRMLQYFIGPTWPNAAGDQDVGIHKDPQLTLVGGHRSLRIPVV